MAVRSPLYLDSGNLKEMSSAMVDEIVEQVVYQYSLNPGVALSVVSSGGTLSSITDTRLQAGASSSGASSFPSEASTAEPSTVTVTYDKVSSTSASLTPTADTSKKLWPVYYTATGHIQAMSLEDVKDTFLHPAIDLLVSGSTGTQQGGTYTVHTANTLAGSTIVDANPIFVDTRADTSAYTAGGIGETLDQPTTITNYYLFKIDGSDTSYTSPMYIRSDNDLQEYTESGFEDLCKEWIRKTAADSVDGYAISYNIGTTGSGLTRGSGMADTI